MGTGAEGVALEDVGAIEVRARLRPDSAGEHTVGCSGVGRFALQVDGAVVFDAELALPPGVDPVEGLMRPPQCTAPVVLEAGREAELLLRHELAAHDQGTSFAVAVTTFALNVEPPHPPEDEELEHAVALAAQADVAVVVVGTTEEVESEGFDRDSLGLPGRQDELVRRVLAANPRTVVVVNAGAPVLVPWADDVPAILLAWFPGQECGHALADVLLGAAEPGGRLPTTWPETTAGLPSTRPAGGVLTYAEGLRIGHRGADGRAPRWAFGHGLGYTTWEYLELAVAGRTVHVRLRNAGERPGREVVQLYASRPDSTVERPPRWLVGFAAVAAGPGEEASAQIAVDERALAHWDGGWHVEPGPFRLAAGRSFSDLRLETALAIT